MPKEEVMFEKEVTRVDRHDNDPHVVISISQLKQLVSEAVREAMGEVMLIMPPVEKEGIDEDIRFIGGIVCEHMGLSLDNLMFVKPTKSDISFARKIVWWNLSDRFYYSHQQIGDWFDKERTVISEGVEHARILRKSNSNRGVQFRLIDSIIIRKINEKN